jgi:hypothetical protein
MAKTIHDDRRSSGDDSSDSQTEVNNVDVSISRRRVVQAGIGAIGLGALATSGTEPVLAAEDISFNLPSGDVEAGVTATVSPFTLSWKQLPPSDPIEVTVSAVPSISSESEVSNTQEVSISSSSGEKQTPEMNVDLPVVGFDDGMEIHITLSHPDVAEAAEEASPQFTVKATAVELSWESNSGGSESGFRVYRSDVDSASFSGGGSDFTQETEISSGTTTYTDSSPPVGADTTVSYAVTAFNDVAESDAAGPVEL